MNRDEVLKRIADARTNGERPDLRGADLSRADLREDDLSRADLREADLRRADLSGACLSGACLSGADLSRANLSGADLSGADLSGANLINTTGNSREVRSMQTTEWMVTYTAEVMAIGCQQYTIAEWWSFDDDRIARMHPQALDWWRVWKPILQQIITIS